MVWLRQLVSPAIVEYLHMRRVKSLLDHFFVKPGEPNLNWIERMFFVVVATAAF